MDVQFSDFLNHAKKSKAELSLKKMLYNLTVFFWKMYHVKLMNKTKSLDTIPKVPFKRKA